MKKFLVLFFILFYSSVNAGSLAVIGGQTVASGGASCSGVYGNNLTTDAGYAGTTGDRLYLTKVTLDCSGTNPDMYGRIRHFSSDTAEAVFCVYSDNGGVPDERLWYSSPWFDAGNTVVQSISQTTSWAATSGTYWLGIATEASSRIYYSSSTGGEMWEVVAQDCFPIPLADLTGIGSVSQTYQLELWVDF